MFEDPHQPNDHVYVYGLVRPGSAEQVGPCVHGLSAVDADTEIRCVDLGLCGALVSAHPGTEVKKRRRHMIAHTRVLEQVMRHAVVLPMRYGVVASGLSALRSALVPRAAEIAELLNRLEGLSEFGLRISWPRDAALAALAASDPDVAAERDRLQGLGAEAHYDRIAFGQRVAELLDRRRQAAQSKMIRELAAVARDHVLLPPESDVETLRAAFLIRNDGEAAFLDRVVDLAADDAFAPGAEPAIQWIGPVPPYNFVSLTLDAGDEVLQAAVGA